MSSLPIYLTIDLEIEGEEEFLGVVFGGEI